MEEKDGMKALVIYKFQAESINETLRKLKILLDREKDSGESCLDREIIGCINKISNVLNETPSTHSSRFKIEVEPNKKP